MCFRGFQPLDLRLEAGVTHRLEARATGDTADPLPEIRRTSRSQSLKHTALLCESAGMTAHFFRWTKRSWRYFNHKAAFTGPRAPQKQVPAAIPSKHKV